MPPPEPRAGATARPSRPPSPWWGVLAAVLTAGAVVLVVGATVSTAVAALATRSLTDTVRAPGVGGVRIEGPAVDVRVRTAADGDVVAAWEVRSTSAGARVLDVRDGDTLVLRLECPEPRPLSRRCDAEVDVALPDGVDLTTDIDVGVVRARGLSGDVDATVNAGDVDLAGLTSQQVRATANVGTVRAAFDAPPADVDVSVNTGAAEVVVPDDGTAYAATAASSVGPVTVVVPVDRDAERAVTVSVNVGAARVRHPDEAGLVGRRDTGG